MCFDSPLTLALLLPLKSVACEYNPTSRYPLLRGPESFIRLGRADRLQARVRDDMPECRGHASPVGCIPQRDADPQSRRVRQAAADKGAREGGAEGGTREGSGGLWKVSR
jgi:hypothetical protein